MEKATSVLGCARYVCLLAPGLGSKRAGAGNRGRRRRTKANAVGGVVITHVLRSILDGTGEGNSGRGVWREGAAGEQPSCPAGPLRRKCRGKDDEGAEQGVDNKGRCGVARGG